VGREESIETPWGPGRSVYFPGHSTLSAAPGGVLLLSHGAGRGTDTADLQALAHGLPGCGWTVVLFEQPWHVAGRKIATSPATLDDGLRAAARALARAPEVDADVPLVVGGRSAGARSAVRCAQALAAGGCLLLSFPLHPPAHRERSRLTELTDAQVPTLVIQGERDPMGRPEEFPHPLPSGSEMVVVPKADHGLRVPKRGDLTEQDVRRLIVDSTARWLARLTKTSRARTEREDAPESTTPGSMAPGISSWESTGRSSG
jgi:uncharacterized protein